jgi:7-cyano-7-deazaguanine synthase in queuosine biosynthesis
MTFGIVGALETETPDVTLAVDQQRTLRIGSIPATDISLRSFGDDLRRAGVLSGRDTHDFFVLATMVFVADTRIAREHGDDGWTRQITLSVPVGDVERWSAATAILERTLRFLTGDLWTVEFRLATTAIQAIYEDNENRPDGEAVVSLFSGGLDSFIGALDAVPERNELVLVGHYTDGSASKPQDKAFAHIERVKPEALALSLLRAWIVAPSDVFGLGNDERQRARSFLFVALGLIIADAKGASELLIPENGLISLNVPMTDLRIGSYSTRTTHPHYIKTLQSALNTLEIGVTLRNPYQFKTKGEMLRECVLPDDLASAVAQTMSCAHPTAGRWARKGAPPLQHCGRCTACLIRRAAIAAALGNDQTDYTEQDLRTAPLRSDSARGADIRAVRLAARRVRDDPAIAELLVLKPGPLPSRYKEYADLYVRGMNELWELVKDVETRGAY